MRQMTNKHPYSNIIPTLETERLRLREWRTSDFEAYLAYRADPELQRYVLAGPAEREAVWENFCAISGLWMLRGIGTFLVADKATDEPVGLAGFWYPLDQEIPELAWSLFPGNMGHGYATEAAAKARDWFFENHRFPKLVSYIHPDNAASCAVAKRLGAELETRVRLYGQDRLVFSHPKPF